MISSINLFLPNDSYKIFWKLFFLWNVEFVNSAPITLIKEIIIPISSSDYQLLLFDVMELGNLLLILA